MYKNLCAKQHVMTMCKGAKKEIFTDLIWATTNGSLVGYSLTARCQKVISKWFWCGGG